MALPGSFNVDERGAASYSIPIAVPPGTAGMSPALSLSYSSQSGGGLGGVGWALTGLPSIGHCPRTMAQDSVRGSVNYDANDRFCMEGQRLVAISGTYGTDGSEYRTEIEGFSKIVAHGTAGNGPSWFEVRTKSGQVLEFGHTTDSLILAQGKTTARNWAVNKISDTKGNYLTVTYTNDTANGQAYPARIDYTGNTAAGLAPYNSVQFVYETHAEIPSAYHAGSVARTTVRLTNIKTYQASNIVFNYKITYQVSSSTGRSRVHSVGLCTTEAGTGCMGGATYFGYSNAGVLPTTMSSNFGYGDGTASTTVPAFADFNGDGRADIIWSYANTTGDFGWNGGTVWLSDRPSTLISGAVFKSPISLAGPFVGSTGTSAMRSIGDFDGDGKADIFLAKGSNGTTSGTGPKFSLQWPGVIGQGGSTWRTKSAGGVAGTSTSGGLKLWKSNGDGTFASVTPTPATIADGSIPLLGDFDGDGRTDILWQYEGNTVCSYGGANTPTDTRTLWRSNGDGTFQVTANVNNANYQLASCSLGLVGGTYVTYKPVISDVNGDGKSDILWTAQYTAYLPTVSRILWISNGDGTFRVVTNVGGMDGNSLTNYPNSPAAVDYLDFSTYSGDFNGDNKADILCLNTTTNAWGAWLSKGDGAFQVPASQVDSTLSGFFPFIADFGGDGRSDIMWFNPTTNARMVWQSNGDGTFTTATTNLNASNGSNVGTIPYVVDVNSDGKADIVWDSTDAYGRSNGTRNLWASDGSISDIMTSFTTGLGATTAITHGALSQAWTFCVLTTCNDGIYTVDTGAHYPIVDVDGPMYVVTGVNAANGVGGTFNSTYYYKGAKVDQNGRGFLGFRQRLITDSNNITQTTTYRQDFPYIGLVASETKTMGTYSGVATLNSTVNTYTATNLGGTRNFVPLTNSIVSSWDYDGAYFPLGNPIAIPPVTTSYQYDAYGNATRVAVLTPDGASKVTTNTYTNDTANWFLGRLTAASVTSTVPSGAGVPGNGNNAPVAIGDSVSVIAGTSVTLDPRTNDSDPDGDALTVTATTSPAHGTVTILSAGTQLQYAAAGGYSGADSFTYTISDGHGHTATATITVAVTVNQSPVANGDAISVARGNSITFDPRLNDNDPEGDTLTVTAVTQPSRGSVAILSSGTQLRYTAATFGTGTYTFTYTISDGHGNTVTATVTVTVT